MSRCQCWELVERGLRMVDRVTTFSIPVRAGQPSRTAESTSLTSTVPPMVCHTDLAIRARSITSTCMDSWILSINAGAQQTRNTTRDWMSHVCGHAQMSMMSMRSNTLTQ
eukprot:1726795-Amphidinium_carterae.1